MLMCFDKSIFTQIGYSFLASSALLSVGLSIAWSSSAVPLLIAGDAGVTITSSQSPWVVSMFTFGCLLSSVYSKYVLDMGGRKFTLMTAAFMFLGAWGFLLFGTNVWYLYVGRFLAGFGFGASSAAVIIYIGEIADKKIRGSLNTIIKFMVNFGQLLAFIVGALNSYNNAIYIYTSITFLTFAFAMFLPESPFYLVKAGKREDAERAFRRLRATNDKKYIDQEIDKMVEIVEHDMESKTTYKELFTNKLNRKALAIAMVMKVTQAATGFFIINSYIETIFAKTGIDISPSIASIIYGAAQLLMVMMAVFFIDTFGRRKLLLSSLFGVAVSQFSLATYFFVQDYLEAGENIMSRINWVPMAALLLFSFAYSVGVGPVTMALDGEIFPMNVKSAAIATGTVVSNVLSMLFIQLFQIFIDIWGIYVFFWFFCTIILLCFVFLFFTMLETKGKSFDEIQRELNDGIAEDAKHYWWTRCRKPTTINITDASII